MVSKYASLHVIPRSQHTLFSILTFSVMTPTCSSFWLSSSLYTLSAYLPFLSGVADLKPPSPLRRAPESLLLAPGYALNAPLIGGCAPRCDDESFGCDVKAYGELLFPCIVLYGAFREDGRPGVDAADAGLERLCAS